MQNHANMYGVIVQELANQQQRHWNAELISHLTPSENRGKHNVFVDVFDQNGNRVRDSALRIGWTWDGRQPNQAAPAKPLDKPDDDWGHGNVDIYEAQTLTVWIEGDGLFSDRVAGIHTRHPDELGPNGETWNSYGHHSFYVRFVRVETPLIIEPPIDPLDPPTAGDLEQRISRIERAMAAMAKGWA